MGPREVLTTVISEISAAVRNWNLHEALRVYKFKD